MWTIYYFLSGSVNYSLAGLISRPLWLVMTQDVLHAEIWVQSGLANTGLLISASVRLASDSELRWDERRFAQLCSLKVHIYTWKWGRIPIVPSEKDPGWGEDKPVPCKTSCRRGKPWVHGVRITMWSQLIQVFIYISLSFYYEINWMCNTNIRNMSLMRYD